MPRLAVLLALVLLALAGCGGDDDGGNGGNTGTGGDTGAQTEDSERAAVEKATRDYIVEQQSDEDDSEQPGAITFEDVQIDGDEAKVKAKSSLTGNQYGATLRKVGDTWRGATLFTDVPSEPAGGGGTSGDPSQGSGKEVSGTEVEKQINTKLLKPFGIDGKADCPPRIKVRRGNNFDCKVVGGNRDASVTVTQKDDQGNLNFKLRTQP